MAQAASELVVVPMRLTPTLPPVHWRLVMWLSAAALLMALVAASYLAYTGNLTTSTYTIQRMQAERDAWKMRNEQLRAELAKARSLTWVEHEAVSRLKMQRPAQLTYLWIEPGSVLARTAETNATSSR